MSLIQQGFEARCQRQPHATALVEGAERWSYGELESTSNRLAHLLIEAGIRRGDRVAFLAPKRPRTLAFVLAALKADAVYIPLDPGSPAARLVPMLAQSQPKLVAVSAECKLLWSELARSHATASVFWLDDRTPECAGVAQWRDLTTLPDRVPATANVANDPAHILFTSGSTGLPKGVVITHANVGAFLDWALPHFDFQPGDRHSSHPPLHFDLSTFDVHGTLRAGGELHLLPAAANLSPGKLLEFMRSARLTQWFSVPSILTYLSSFDLPTSGDLPELRRLLWCGEVLPTPVLIHWMQRVPRARFTNLYGPTEATIASTYYDVEQLPTDPLQPIPIGTPCAGEAAYVLDEQLRELPAGETGELYLAGAGLSPGYLGDADKTAVAFPSWQRADGSCIRLYRTGDLARRDAQGILHYAGRADMQIKSRGYRIELGEIEAALHSLRELDQSAVVAIPSAGFDGWTICAAYVLKAQQSLTPAALRKLLTTLLPNYMLPARWAALADLPKNANGKIDRPALRALFTTKAQPSETTE